VTTEFDMSVSIDAFDRQPMVTLSFGLVILRVYHRCGFVPATRLLRPTSQYTAEFPIWSGVKARQNQRGPRICASSRWLRSRRVTVVTTMCSTTRATSTGRLSFQRVTNVIVLPNRRPGDQGPTHSPRWVTPGAAEGHEASAGPEIRLRRRASYWR
jgi:hypothetical protein